MAIKYSFTDNTVYGVDDVNDITRCLTGAGVAPFVEKDSYDVSDLNAMTSALVESGIQLGGCKCTVENAGTSEMRVHIAQGIIFFESGVRLEVDSDGYTIYVSPNISGTVYAHYSPSLQKADIVFSAELPTNGEVVELATISENGKITDIRKPAVSKIASVGKNVMLKLPFERLTEAVEHNGRYITAKVTGVDLSRFNYAVLVATNRYGDVFTYYPNLGYRTLFFDIATGKADFTLYEGETPASSMDYFHNLYSEYVYYLEIVDGELCVVCKCKESNKSSAVSNTLGCTICLM